MWSISKQTPSSHWPVSNRPFTSHETVTRFYAKTAREEHLNAKRRLGIYLSLGQDVVGKEGASVHTTPLPELLEITFKVILPGRQNPEAPSAVSTGGLQFLTGPAKIHAKQFDVV